jgi:hypothetical protein
MLSRVRVTLVPVSYLSPPSAVHSYRVPVKFIRRLNLSCNQYICCTKKDRNKRHSSPFMNVVKGVFFVVRVTLVPVSYLFASSAVHNYRLPGKFIRRLKSLFVWYENFIRLVHTKYVHCR